MNSLLLYEMEFYLANKMETALSRILNFEKIDALLEGFNKTTGFVTAILDLEGNILSKSGWREACTLFHRMNPDSAQKCRISDTMLANKMKDGEKYHYYKCLNGLVDVAVPIVIKGKHIANLFSGQFFFENPDLDHFKQQAVSLGFDVDAYMEAIKKVPVVSEATVKIAMNFLLQMTELISELGYQNVELELLNNTLIESEERFSRIFKSSPIAISIVDKKTGIFKDVNDAWRQLFECDDVDLFLLSYKDLELIPKPSMLKIKSEYRREGKVEKLEIHVFTKNKKLKTVQFSLLNLKIKGKIYLISLISDITEKVNAEKEIKDHRFLLETVINYLPAAVSVLDGNSLKIILANKAYRDFAPGKEMIGLTWDQLWPETGQDFKKICDQVIETGIPYIVYDEKNTIYRGPDLPLETAYFSWSLHRILLPGVQGWGLLGTSWETTNQKKLQDEILANQVLISEMGRVAKIGGWEFDVETGEGTWTEETSKIHDLDPHNPTNVEIGISFYKPKSKAKIEQAIADAIKYGKPYSLELELVSANGIEKWVQTIGTPIFENEKVVKLRGSFQDITERKQIEARIFQLNNELESKVLERTAQLEASNKELEAFSYSVSHDLRVPLRHINGFVDLLNVKYGNDLPDKAQHYLQVITEASKKMGNLIDDLLRFSRTGRQELKKEWIDMNMVVNEAISQINIDLKDQKVDWKIDPLPAVFADFSLLKQVWINLIDNALKYSRKKDVSIIKIGTKDLKNQIQFFIQDNGVGFDMKYSHKLFGVFQRLHAASEFEGTGIGLANVQRIIYKHNGTVTAEAELNRGATFYFTLPKN